MTVICALDIETDGLHPGRQAWDVAMIRRDDSGRQQIEQFYLPVNLATADPQGLRVGGFYDRHPLGIRVAHPERTSPGRTKDAASAARLIARMTHQATIVGATPNFDTEVLDRLLRDHGLVPSWRYRLRCVTTLAAGHLQRDTGGLAESARALDVEPRDEHTAIGDAWTALGIWDRIMTTGRAA